MIAHELGKFIAGLTFEQLPAPVVESAKLRVLDVIASALVGHRLQAHRRLLPLLANGGPSTAWGEGTRTSLRDAVLVNSFLAHASYLEDGSRFVGGHPASAIIPGVLALAEARGASGSEVIAAVVCGYDIFLRIGRPLYPSAVKRGFQTTAILGSVGLAAACANLLRLDDDAAKNAISIACNLSGGLKEATKSPALQPLQVAHSCHGGLVAALLAQAGGAGADAIFENGYFPAHAEQPDTSVVLGGLGSEFRILETYIKMHGGCRGNHAPTDLVLGVAKQHAIRADDVERIALRVDSVTQAADIEHPATGEQAQFCVAFSAALALIDGSASIFQFSDERLGDPVIRSLMKRISVSVDPRLDAGYPFQRGAAIDIALKDGRCVSGQIDNARGEPEAPFTRAEIEDKFMALMKDVLRGRAQQVRATVLELERLPTVNTLLDALNDRHSQ